MNWPLLLISVTYFVLTFITALGLTFIIAPGPVYRANDAVPVSLGANDAVPVSLGINVENAATESQCRPNKIPAEGAAP